MNNPGEYLVFYGMLLVFRAVSQMVSRPYE